MINFNDVFKSYNGKSGCMCGCQGRYSLSTHASIDEANNSVGWNAYDADSVSDRRVKIAIKKINDAIEEFGDRMANGEFDCDGFHLSVNDNHASIDDGSRTTVVYFK